MGWERVFLVVVFQVNTAIDVKDLLLAIVDVLGPSTMDFRILSNWFLRRGRTRNVHYFSVTAFFRGQVLTNVFRLVFPDHSLEIV